MIPWEILADYAEKDYGAEIDWREGFFICPFCGEPIYAEDFPEVDKPSCPCCDFMF